MKSFTPFQNFLENFSSLQQCAKYESHFPNQHQKLNHISKAQPNTFSFEHSNTHVVRREAQKTSTFLSRGRLTRVPMGHFWTITFQTQKPSRIKQSISVSLTSQYSQLRRGRSQKASEKSYFCWLFTSIEKKCVSPQKRPVGSLS